MRLLIEPLSERTVANCFLRSSAQAVQVLEEVAAGNANKMVADNLHVSEETVKSHMRSILSKLGANDRTHAVTIAIKRGIIEL